LASRPALLVVGGVVWAVMLIVGVALGKWTAAAVVIPVAAVATASLASKRRPVSPPALAGLIASLVLPLAAIAGPTAAIASSHAASSEPTNGTSLPR